MNEVTKFWINPKSENGSALKVYATPKTYEMSLYAKGSPKGEKVDGLVFYKISIGEDMDYDAVDEKTFDEYIKKIK